MKHRLISTVCLTAGLLLTEGCATGEEWQIWAQHRTHFASGGHLFFSARNLDEASLDVTRRDIVLARRESWWGDPVLVSQEQIVER